MEHRTTQYDHGGHDNERDKLNAREISDVGVAEELVSNNDTVDANLQRSESSDGGVLDDSPDTHSRPLSMIDNGNNDDSDWPGHAGMHNLPADQPDPTVEYRRRISAVLTQETQENIPDPRVDSGIAGRLELPYIDTNLSINIGQLGQDTSFVTAPTMFDSPASMAPSELNRAPTLPVEQETQAAGSGHVHQSLISEGSLNLFPNWDKISHSPEYEMRGADKTASFGANGPPVKSGQYVDNMDQEIYASEWTHWQPAPQSQNLEYPAQNSENRIKMYSRQNTREMHQKPQRGLQFHKVLKSRPNPIIQATANHIPGEHIIKPQSSLDQKNESGYPISGQPSGIPEDSVLWEHYVHEAEQQDSEKVANWNQTMDVLLVFATLFSGILTAFIIDVYKALKPDPQHTVVVLLQNISIALQGHPQNATVPSASAMPSAAFVPTYGYIWVNGLFFASLSCSLSTAMLIILIKQWLQFYSVKHWSGNGYQYAKHRQYKYNALQKWQVSTIISLLPLLLHTAVVLFAIGLVILLLQINSAIAYAVTGLIASLLLAYGVFLMLPLVFDDCPYQSSASVLLGIFGHFALVLIYATANQTLLFIKKLACHDHSFSSDVENTISSGLKKSLSQLNYLTESSELMDSRSLDYTALDQDSLIWLASISKDTAVVENSLAAIKHLAPTSDMIDKMLERNILADLARKAYVPLPAKSDAFWKKTSLLDSHAMAPLQEIEEAAPYMESLLRAWNHSAYLDPSLPPAISEEVRQTTHAWLLYDWILLWRRLRQHSDVKTIIQNGWSFEAFVLIICVEVMFYQIHVQPKSIPIVQQISLSFNLEEPNPLHDLYDVVEQHYIQNINASEKLICYLFTTMKQVLVTADLSQHPDFKHKTLHLFLRCWKHHDGHAQRAACYQIIICIKLLITSNADERRVWLINESITKFVHPVLALQVFTSLIKDQLAINQLQPPKKQDTQTIALVAAEIYNILCAKPELGDRYSAVIFMLPTVIADELAQSLASRAVYQWKENAELVWFVDFVLQLSSKGNLSIHGHMNLGFCLQDVLEFLSDRKDYVAHPLRHKILSFFVHLEHEYAEGKVAILHGILDNAIFNTNNAVLDLFLSMEGPSKVCAYINAAPVAKAISEKWKQLHWDLKVMLAGRTQLSQTATGSGAKWHNSLQQLHSQLASILMKSAFESFETTQAGPNPLVDTTDYALTTHMSNLSAVSFSSDGKLMASGSWNATLCIWDVTSETLLGRPLSKHTQGISAVCFSASGKSIASGSGEGSICIWGVGKLELITIRSEAHTDAITSLAFSPNEQYVLSSSWDKTLCVWNVISGDVLWQNTATGVVTSVAFSPDAELVAAGSTDGHISLWNAITGNPATGAVVPELSGHVDFITAVVFIDNQHLISSSWDDTVRIWDLSTGLSSRWTNTGTTASNGVQDGQDLTPLAVSPDSLLVASALWNDVVCSKVSGDSIRHHNLKAHKKEVTAVAFSPNQAFIVSGSKDNTVRIWNVSKQTQILDAMFGHKDEISSVTYSYNNKLVASGSKDKTICIWNAETGSLVKQLHDADGAVHAVSFSPSGKEIVCGSSNNSIYIWDVTSGSIIKSLHEHLAPVIFVSYSTDGKFIISSASDHVVCIWNASTGECVKRLVNILETAF